MRITANGRARDVPEGLTVAGLVEHLSLPAGSVAVQRNGDALLPGDHGTTTIAEGDEFEIVKAVAGG